MKWTQNYLSLGVLFIMLGIILLVITSGGTEGSVFFIFPFFFSVSNPISILLFLIYIIFIFRIMIRKTSDFFDNNLTKKYLPVGSECEYCSTALPVNAFFCPNCGNTVDYDTMSNH